MPTYLNLLYLKTIEDFLWKATTLEKLKDKINFYYTEEER
jgi:hypothetical protein